MNGNRSYEVALNRKLALLENANKILIRALEFYAEEDNWNVLDIGMVEGGVAQDALINYKRMMED